MKKESNIFIVQLLKLVDIFYKIKINLLYNIHFILLERDEIKKKNNFILQ